MPRRVTPAQLRSQLRQAQQKQRQAINKYNADVRRHNSEVRRAVDNYNRDVRTYNATVRTNRQRLEREIRRLNSSSRSTTVHVTYRQSVSTFQQSFEAFERAASTGSWSGDPQLLDMSEGEAANSVAVLNAMLGHPADEGDTPAGDLADTTLEAELEEISPDLQARWVGALYSLSPRNPDAARHFCTSAREILTSIIETEAPDAVVLAADPSASTTSDGRVTRRAKVQFCLARRGQATPELVNFVDEDLENVVTLFREFNDATHGGAGRFNLGQLTAIKKRVEDAVRFLHRLLR